MCAWRTTSGFDTVCKNMIHKKFTKQKRQKPIEKQTLKQVVNTSQMKSTEKIMYYKNAYK